MYLINLYYISITIKTNTMTTKLSIYKRTKLDLLQSKDLNELKVAHSFMELAKFHVNHKQWSDLTKNYFLKRRLLTENIN